MAQNNQKALALSAAVICLLALCGCGGRQYSTVRSSFVEFSEDQILEIESNRTEQYRIQPNDVLQVAFENQDDLNQDPVLVLPDGAISMVGLDRLVVAGMTLEEADTAITNEFGKEYRDPRISVIVRETAGLQVYVLGEVKSPGVQTMPRGGLQMIGAVTLAGGFTPDAAPDGAVLVRVTAEGYLVQEINLSGFYEVTSLELAMIDLYPNDIIYVPRSRIGDFSYFCRSVLTGVTQITRIAYDLKYLTGGNLGRY